MAAASFLLATQPERHLTGAGLPSKQLPAPDPDQPYPQQQDQQQQQPASSSGVVQGYIVVQVNSVTAHINKLAVAPEAQRTGLATRLLKVGFVRPPSPADTQTLFGGGGGGQYKCARSWQWEGPS